MNQALLDALDNLEWGSTQKEQSTPLTPAQVTALLEYIDELESRADTPPEVDDALSWLADRIHDGRGPVTFCVTENGDIGLLLFADPADDSVKCDGVGDEVIRAILSARRRRPWLVTAGDTPAVKELPEVTGEP